jgi:hypothetical protein
LAKAEKSRPKGLTSKGKALLIFHEGGTKFPPRPAGRKKKRKTVKKPGNGKKEK